MKAIIITEKRNNTVNIAKISQSDGKLKLEVYSYYNSRHKYHYLKTYDSKAALNQELINSFYFFR